MSEEQVMRGDWHIVLPFDPLSVHVWSLTANVGLESPLENCSPIKVTFIVRNRLFLGLW